MEGLSVTKLQCPKRAVQNREGHGHWAWAFVSTADGGKEKGPAKWAESMRQPRHGAAQVENSVPKAGGPRGKEVVRSGMPVSLGAGGGTRLQLSPQEGRGFSMTRM